MKERPILFNAEMVRSILDGRKTQTRRVVKPQPYVDEMGNFCWNGSNFGQHYWYGPLSQTIATFKRKGRVGYCPYGAPGDRLWIRETWRPSERFDTKYIIKYRADGSTRIINVGWHGITPALDAAIERQAWKPSIHMPRWASRILLEVTDVRVERVQDINEDDARAEGVEGEIVHRGWNRDGDIASQAGSGMSYVEGFRSLWSSINGPEAWEANPWIWVVEFELIEVAA